MAVRSYLVGAAVAGWVMVVSGVWLGAGGAAALVVGGGLLLAAVSVRIKK